MLSAVQVHFGKLMGRHSEHTGTSFGWLGEWKGTGVENEQVALR